MCTYPASDHLSMKRGGVRGRARLAVLLAAVIGLGTPSYAAPVAAGMSARHPDHNIAAKPSYTADCAHYRSNSAGCLAKALAAINRARSFERVRPMILPDNFTKLTYAEQTFVVSDLERVDRGLKPFRGLTNS